jgi:hypothetical protein
MGKANSIAAALLILMALVMSCDESLPPYQDPRNILQASMRGRYVLSPDDNSLHVTLIVKNVYEETIQAQATLRGTIVVTAKRNSSIQITLPITANNITYATSYNRATGILTIDPQDTVVFSASWSFIDNAGRDLRQMFFDYTPDPTCSFREIAAEETFILDGSVKVYDMISDVTAEPIEFSMCHVTNWVDTRTCYPVFTDQPCGSRL